MKSWRERERERYVVTSLLLQKSAGPGTLLPTMRGTCKLWRTRTRLSLSVRLSLCLSVSFSSCFLYCALAFTGFSNAGLKSVFPLIHEAMKDATKADPDHAP